MRSCLPEANRKKLTGYESPNWGKIAAIWLGGMHGSRSADQLLEDGKEAVHMGFVLVSPLHIN